MDAGMTSGWAKVVYVFVLGAVLALALPPLGLWPVIFVSLPLFLVSLDGKRPFFTGWLFGFGYFCVALHWIGFAFLVDAKTYLWMMPFAVSGLAAFLSLYWGLAAKLTQLCAKQFGLPSWIMFPCLLALCEVLRGRLFTGFAWAAPGMIADGMGGVVQTASLIGMTGLTLMILLWAAAALPICLGRSELAARRSSRLLSLLVLSSLPLAWAWGEARLSQTPTEFVDGVTVRLVQPNVAQGDKWSKENSDAIFSDLLDLSTSGKQTTHILWPESAVPFLIDESAAARLRLDEALDDTQTLVTGAIRRSSRSASADYFTSVLSFDGKGEVRGVYDKWRLVPGGEFLPLEWLLEPLGFKKLVTLPGGFRPGPGAGSIEIAGLGRAGALICYEVIFPHELVSTDQRPDLLINLTNDGWFGNSTGPHQHFAQARLRSIEHGLPLLRAANTGISGSIDPFGRVLARTILGERKALDVSLARPIERTFYSRYGDLILLVMLFVLVAISPLFSRVNRDEL
jgi:apolipoprotein N-acyltransferase